jgi:hypothetical protein
MAVDNRGDFSVFDGSNWSPHADLGGNGVTSVSCPADGICMVVTHYSHAFLYLNGQWTKSPPLNGPDADFPTVSCASARVCVAVSTEGDAVTWTRAQQG